MENIEKGILDSIIHIVSQIADVDNLKHKSLINNKI